MTRHDLFSFSGRIGRRRWWIGQIAVAAYVFVVAFVAASLGVVGFDRARPPSAEHPMTLAGLGFTLLSLVALWPSLALAAKRWHDRDKTGWWSLIALVPVLGALWMLVELGLLRGSETDNRFGPPEVSRRRPPA